MLRLINVRKTFADRTLYANVSFSISPGERVGIIGGNGSGKSTLLEIASGAVDPDEGQVLCSTRIAYLRQNLVLQDKKSGGERQKQALYELFASDAELLLMDEPTTNLDEESIRWLERLIQNSNATCLIASHDKTFLDNIVSSILLVDPLVARCSSYSGNYSFYEQKCAADENYQWRMYSQQQATFKQLECDIRETKQQALRTEQSTTDDRLRRYAKKVAKKAKARETRLKRIMDSETKIEKPRNKESIRLIFSSTIVHNKVILETRDLRCSNGDDVILSRVNLQLLARERVLLTGRNGSGKTTLIESILGIRQCMEGQILKQGNSKISYIAQNVQLPEEARIIDWFDDQVMLGQARSRRVQQMMRSQSETRTFLHRFLFSRDDVFKTLGVLSLGEKMRLLLAAAMVSDPDLLVLDEPTNHLDIQSVQSVKEALSNFEGSIIMVSHDRDFQQHFRADTVWECRNGNVLVLPGSVLLRSG